MGKLDLELEVLKCKIHEEDVLDDFKVNLLEKKLKEKYESYEPKCKSKITFNFYNYFGKAVAVFACFMVMSTCAFADEIEGMFNLLFANTHKSIETAYEEGNIKEIDSEYQTYDGVSLKVDYVSVNENEISIMLNINTDIDYKTIYIEEMVVTDENDSIIYPNDNIRRQKNSKRIEKNNSILTFVFSKYEMTFEQYNSLKIYIDNIEFVLKDEKKEKIDGNWNFEINLNELSQKS